MSRALLFAAVAVCLLSVASGAFLSQQLYLTADGTCSGAPYFYTNTTLGECKSVGAGTGYWTSTFCSTAGDSYTVATYTDQNCTAVFSVAQTPTGCNKVSRSLGYVCVGTGPTAPALLSRQSTTYYNQTSGKPATACAVSTGVIASTVSSVDNTCVKRDVTNKTPSSSKGYCTSDGKFAGTATYASLDCSGDVVQANYAAVTDLCTNGVLSSGCSGVDSFPTLPSLEVQEYEADDCTGDVKEYAFVSPNCFDEQTIVCSTVNATTMAVVSQFPSAAKGVCSGTATSVNYFPDGVCTKGIKPSCGGSSPSSAATASSAVALLVAAVAALLATRA